ncbi:uncharacterized protein B0H18DRAFT_962612 [Fomitopsis serialis]|uniref:uncharacterized protein n=1 Tax=Fomitopsis serialis TaxID=139415 RepID=UPI00200875A6|nr:uncharacterized protein B0H18DRAFT_962612 [Neoantrodia serialis]KAH9910960.1 hypothetical protein B0H18DRAFT_962612 [Neoantrodia serialis]
MTPGMPGMRALSGLDSDDELEDEERLRLGLAAALILGALDSQLTRATNHRQTYLTCPELMPDPRINTPWQHITEWNLTCIWPVSNGVPGLGRSTPGLPFGAAAASNELAGGRVVVWNGPAGVLGNVPAGALVNVPAGGLEKYGFPTVRPDCYPTFRPELWSTVRPEASKNLGFLRSGWTHIQCSGQTFDQCPSQRPQKFGLSMVRPEHSAMVRPAHSAMIRLEASKDLGSQCSGQDRGLISNLLAGPQMKWSGQAKFHLPNIWPEALRNLGCKQSGQASLAEPPSSELSHQARYQTTTELNTRLGGRENLAGLGAEDKWPRLGPRFQAPSSVKTTEVKGRAECSMTEFVVEALSSEMAEVKPPSSVKNGRAVRLPYKEIWYHLVALHSQSTVYVP